MCLFFVPFACYSYCLPVTRTVCLLFVCRPTRGSSMRAAVAAHASKGRPLFACSCCNSGVEGSGSKSAPRCVRLLQPTRRRADLSRTYCLLVIPTICLLFVPFDCYSYRLPVIRTVCLLFVLLFVPCACYSYRWLVIRTPKYHPRFCLRATSHANSTSQHAGQATIFGHFPEFFREGARPRCVGDQREPTFPFEFLSQDVLAKIRARKWADVE